jgi:hypothetical protein
MVGKEIARDDVRRRALGDTTDMYQPMLRETGRVFGTPRPLTLADAEDRAERLHAVVWYNLRTGEAVYSRHLPYSDAPNRV